MNSLPLLSNNCLIIVCVNVKGSENGVHNPSEQWRGRVFWLGSHVALQLAHSVHICDGAHCMHVVATGWSGTVSTVYVYISGNNMTHEHDCVHDLLHIITTESGVVHSHAPSTAPCPSSASCSTLTLVCCANRYSLWPSGQSAYGTATIQTRQSEERSWSILLGYTYVLAKGIYIIYIYRCVCVCVCVFVCTLVYTRMYTLHLGWWLWQS